MTCRKTRRRWLCNIPYNYVEKWKQKSFVSKMLCLKVLWKEHLPIVRFNFSLRPKIWQHQMKTKPDGYINYWMDNLVMWISAEMKTDPFYDDFPSFNSYKWWNRIFLWWISKFQWLQQMCGLKLLWIAVTHYDGDYTTFLTIMSKNENELKIL